MLDDTDVATIAGDAARAWLPAEGLVRVLTDYATDSTGADAVRITFVLTPQASDELTGDDALDVLVEVKTKLAAAGEKRSSIIEYATEQELQADDI